MADRPIIFSAPMVRALLEGKKTQTRRVLRPQPDTTSDPSGSGEWGAVNRYDYWRPAAEVRPYQVGDRLYVREAHALVPATAYRMSKGVTQAVDPSDRDRACVYREGWERCAPRWRPSIHMPRWASRLTLTVTDVRVQRLQEISEADAVAEGCEAYCFPGPWWQGYCDCGNGDLRHQQVIGDAPPDWMIEPHRMRDSTHLNRSAVNNFTTLWNSLHGPDAWDANPWVVALTFDVVRQNIDRMPGVAG